MKFGMIPMAAIVAGFIIAAAVSVVVVQSTASSGHQQVLAERMTAEFARQVEIKVETLNELLRRLAESETATTAIRGSNAQIIDAESALMMMIPGADRVSLIKRGQAKPDQKFPPINYTSVDIINKLETGQKPSPEAISSQPQLGGDRWVVFAQAIKSHDGSLLGTLFVHIRADTLMHGVTSGTDGAASIMQAVGTSPKPVASAGSGGSGVFYTTELSNPNWTFQYSPAGPIASSSPASIVIFFAPPFAMLLVALIGVFLGSNKTASTIQSDLSALGKQLSRVAAGGFDNGISYQIPGFEDLNSRLKVFEEMKPAPAAQPAATPKIEAAPVKPAKAKESEMVGIEMIDENVEVEEIEVDDFDDVIEQVNAEPEATSPEISEHIFRAYDIRGVVGSTLSEDIARQIGLAIGSEAGARGEQSLYVGFDGRDYSPALAEALIDGLTSTGREVLNIGSVPTPVLYFGTSTTDTTSGVMVTGSHNAPDYNGFKVVLGGKSLTGDEIQILHQRIRSQDFSSGDGTVGVTDITQEYMDAIADDVVVAQPLKVVIDCGNGIAGAIAPELLDSLGCEAVPLYCEVDGSFPNHHPDPTKPENLEDLALTVQSQGADLGIALDGDGDRLVAVTAEGDVVWPDRLLMLFAEDIVSRNPGSDVVYDVKCTRHLNSVISGFGGRPIISRSGHSYIKQKVAETGAMLGGELSGHICFSERWYGFDDGLYSAARLLEIVGSQEDSLSDLLKEFPQSVVTPEIHIAVDDTEKFALIDSLTASADFEDATLTTIDGLRVDFSDGWGLIRASNTEPAITLRFEADNEEALEDIKGAFKDMLQEVRKDLDFA